MPTGVIKFYNADKGFGFILQELWNAVLDKI